MKATVLFHEKRIVVHSKTDEIGLVELKIWKIPRSEHYPQGRKFSLFLVLHGEVLVGIDNHKPKGPHRHIKDVEVPYEYVNEERLLSDFWSWVRKEGFKI